MPIAETSKVFIKLNQISNPGPPTQVDAEADLSTITTTGYTLNWTVNAADTAALGTQILTLAFAPISPASVTAATVTSLSATRYDRGVLCFRFSLAQVGQLVAD